MIENILCIHINYKKSKYQLAGIVVSVKDLHKIITTPQKIVNRKKIILLQKDLEFKENHDNKILQFLKKIIH